MISVEDKILERIKRNGRGWVMTNRDFVDLAKSATVDWSLYRLKEKKVIRTVLRGIYDYPKFSELLQEELAPDLELVARAIARKNQWNIQISGSASLNYIGLSTQIPMQIIYFSDGPNRKFEVFGKIMQFKHIQLRETKFTLPKSEIIVHSLRELGEANISDDVIEKMRAFVPPNERTKILKDTKFVTGWIQSKIDLICRKEE